ncbi:cerebral dopamine neurotrophic factor-like, partial [Arapaima gigas]
IPSYRESTKQLELPSVDSVCLATSALFISFIMALGFPMVYLVITEGTFMAVCVGFLGRLYEGLRSQYAELTAARVEDGLLRACAQASGKENRLCYYLGATSDAAIKITGEVTRPMSFHLPVEKICERLHKRDGQICELRYEKDMVDFSKESLSKLRVAELKRILSSWGEVCRACFEKTDFVNLIREVAPKHTPQMGQKTDL